MGFLLVGLALLAMKMAEFGPGADWPWWAVLAPFGLAVVWWQLVDSTGVTQRRAMDKMDQKKVDRRNRSLEALGMDPRRHVRSTRDGRPPTAPAGKHSAKNTTVRAREDASVH